ncbi:peptidase c45 [Anaeramoeba ignava]|uniref:Peptidase c45 n=1 Tax=Anaeramoeba ignava TaxID=1746090 RepID=A0A9Q0R7E7_ANAIG|nr:peptidase c45 [Anaeramoeba ignava]
MNSFIFFCFLFLFLISITKSIPTIEVKSPDHFEIGKQIGLAMKERIYKYFEESAVLNYVLIPWFENHLEEYTQFYDANYLKYPHYMDELRGLASGADVSFHKVFLLTLSLEISLLVQSETGKTVINYVNPFPQPELEACSDVLINDQKVILGHNEDANINITDTSAFVFVNQTGTTSNEANNYFTFMYPGSLWGIAYGFNDHNLMFSMNAVFPKCVQIGGHARSFIARDTLTSTSFDEMISKIKNSSIASGFSLNVLDGNTKKIYNIEAASSYCQNTTFDPFLKSNNDDPNYTLMNVLEVTQNNYSEHFNMFLRLNVSQYTDESSVHRLKRAEEIGSPLNNPNLAQGIVDILGDTQDTQWPIYRDAIPPDSAKTITTSIFDWDQKTLSIYDNNPKINFDNPYKVFQLY